MGTYGKISYVPKPSTRMNQWMYPVLVSLKPCECNIGCVCVCVLCLRTKVLAAGAESSRLKSDVWEIPRVTHWPCSEGFRSSPLRTTTISQHYRFTFDHVQRNRTYFVRRPEPMAAGQQPRGPGAHGQFEMSKVNLNWDQPEQSEKYWLVVEPTPLKNMTSS